MNERLAYDVLKEKLRAAANPTQRRLYFAALLASAAGIPTDEFFVVGGSAIEFYTVGEYTSGDIDVVSGRNERLREVLAAWDFEGPGRVWSNEELGLVVDLNRYPYAGDVERTQVVTTPYGAIRLAAIEDLLVKRLISTKFWTEKGDLEQAKLLALAFWDRIDWAYAERFAREEDVVDLLTSLREAVGAEVRRRRRG